MKKIFFLIGIGFLLSQPASARVVWEDYAIELSGGGYIWAKVEESQGCYNLLVGSNDTNINGSASNCSNDISGYWSTYACGNGSFGVNGGISEVINAILQRC